MEDHNFKMKKIGLIGGMSWESSLVYYKIMNEKVNQLRGGFHSCKLVMESVDFAEIEALQHKNDWKSLDNLMVAAAQNLEKAGAEVIVLCTNTMHLCSDAIQANTNIPFIHIAEATGKALQQSGIDKALLLGTKFTMERRFYTEILQQKFNIETLVPNEQDREIVHRIIYQELVHGKITSTAKETYQHIIEKSAASGAEGVILGCTEIPLLIQSKDVSIPVFDTTRIHAESAIRFALNHQMEK